MSTYGRHHTFSYLLRQSKFNSQSFSRILSVCLKYMHSFIMPSLSLNLGKSLFGYVYILESWLFLCLNAYEMYHIRATLKIHFPLPWFSSSMLLSDAIVSLHFHLDEFWTGRTLYGKWITKIYFSDLLLPFFGISLLSDHSTVYTVSYTTDTCGLPLTISISLLH